jgi:hypothetical protein
MERRRIERETLVHRRGAVNAPVPRDESVPSAAARTARAGPYQGAATDGSALWMRVVDAGGGRRIAMFAGRAGLGAASSRVSWRVGDVTKDDGAWVSAGFRNPPVDIRASLERNDSGDDSG